MADTENKEEKKLEVNLIKKEGKPESQAKPVICPVSVHHLTIICATSFPGELL